MEKNIKLKIGMDGGGMDAAVSIALGGVWLSQTPDFKIGRMPILKSLPVYIPQQRKAISTNGAKVPVSCGEV